MYNGIGLQTARGSGTNGYVQCNKFFVKSKIAKVVVDNNKGFAPDQGTAGVTKKPNKDILEHDRKRQIELKVAILEDKLIDQGYTEAEIVEKIEEARRMLEAADAAAADAGSGTGAVVVSEKVSDTQTHQIAARKEKQMETLRAAFGIVDESDEVGNRRRGGSNDDNSEFEEGEIHGHESKDIRMGRELGEDVEFEKVGMDKSDKDFKTNKHGEGGKRLKEHGKNKKKEDNNKRHVRDSSDTDAKRRYDSDSESDSIIDRRNSSSSAKKIMRGLSQDRLKASGFVRKAEGQKKRQDYESSDTDAEGKHGSDSESDYSESDSSIEVRRKPSSLQKTKKSISHGTDDCDSDDSNKEHLKRGRVRHDTDDSDSDDPDKEHLKRGRVRHDTNDSVSDDPDKEHPKRGRVRHDNNDSDSDDSHKERLKRGRVRHGDRLMEQTASMKQKHQKRRHGSEPPDVDTDRKYASHSESDLDLEIKRMPRSMKKSRKNLSNDGDDSDFDSDNSNKESRGRVGDKNVKVQERQVSAGNSEYGGSSGRYKTEKMKQLVKKVRHYSEDEFDVKIEKEKLADRERKELSRSQRIRKSDSYIEDDNNRSGRVYLKRSGRFHVECGSESDQETKSKRFVQERGGRDRRQGTIHDDLDPSSEEILDRGPRGRGRDSDQTKYNGGRLKDAELEDKSWPNRLRLERNDNVKYGGNHRGEEPKNGSNNEEHGDYIRGSKSRNEEHRSRLDREEEEEHYNRSSRKNDEKKPGDSRKRGRGEENEHGSWRHERDRDASKRVRNDDSRSGERRRHESGSRDDHRRQH